MTRNRPEADHERGVVAPLYGNCGFSVYATSARVHPVGVTPGIADLIVHADLLGFAFYHETKVGTERQSSAQWDFMASAQASAIPYVLGDVESANQFLCWLGIAVPVGSTIRFHPKGEWVRRLDAALPDDLPVAYHWQRSQQHNDQLRRWGFKPSVGPLHTRTKRGGR